MGLIKATNFKGKEASYFGNLRTYRDRQENKTTAFVYLYWDKDHADNYPLENLDHVMKQYEGILADGEVYALLMAEPEFEGAASDI